METLLLPPRPLPPGTTGLLGAPFAAQLQPVVAINCGGKGAAEFTEDVNVSGGAPVSTDAAITGAAAAPEAVYKTQRSGDCTYVISGLDPKSCYRLELHFAELVFNANGQRTFDVTINGVLALSKFDVYRSATAKNKAVTHVFSVVPDSLGSLTLGFTSGVNEATVAGVSVAKVIRFPVSSPGFSLVKPYDVLARAGDPVSFASRINGKSPTLFQWRRNGTSVTGATRTIFSIPEVTLAQAGSYSVLAGGTVAGPAASLIVAGEASFSRSVQPGGTGWLTVPFAGAGASFRWLLNGNPLSDGNGITGARTNKLTIGGFKLGNEGDYQCVVSAFGDSETFGPYNIHLMRPPELTNGAPPDAIIIGTFKWQLTSNESQTSYAVTGLPPGLVYNPATATISGTATKSGFYNISVVPSNPAGIGPLKTFVLKVEPVPISVRGNFAGLIDRQSTVNGNLGGSLRFTVGSTGLLSGRLVNGKVEYSFTGRLSGTAGGDPSCKVRILRAIGSPLDLFFTLQRSDGSMTGSLGVGTALALLRGRPVAVTSAAATSTELNCFLGLVDAQDVGTAAMPQGTGWMRVPRTIGNGGIAVSGTGRLPDGTPVSFSSNECADGEVPVFMILPAGNGSVLGWFQIDAQSPSLQTLGGTLNWRKTGPSSSTDYTYRSGINVNLSA
jgi:hypothetical protein